MLFVQSTLKIFINTLLLCFNLVGFIQFRLTSYFTTFFFFFLQLLSFYLFHVFSILALPFVCNSFNHVAYMCIVVLSALIINHFGKIPVVFKASTRPVALNLLGVEDPHLQLRSCI